MERRYYFYIALFLTIVIAIGSLVSLKNVVVETKITNLDKVLHVGAYFALTLSWLLTFKKSDKTVGSSLIIAVAVFAYGIIIEALQGAITSYRQADLYDLLANFGGIVVAYLFFSSIYQKKRVN